MSWSLMGVKGLTYIHLTCQRSEVRDNWWGKFIQIEFIG